MGADQSKQLENTLFNLKFSSKNLARESKKCVKSESEEKTKLKRAIQKGNMEGARIHAENAIRQKNQVQIHFNFLTNISGSEFSPTILSRRCSSFTSPNGSVDAARDERHDFRRPLNGRRSQIYELGADFQHARSFREELREPRCPISSHGRNCRRCYCSICS